MRVKFIGGVADGTARSIDTAPGLPEHIHVPAPTAGDPGAMADYEPVTGRFEAGGDGDPGAWLYVHTGPAPRVSG